MSTQPVTIRLRGNVIRREQLPVMPERRRKREEPDEHEHEQKQVVVRLGGKEIRRDIIKLEKKFNKDNLILNAIVRNDIEKYISPVSFQILYKSKQKLRLLVIIPIPKKTKCDQSPKDNKYLDFCNSLGFFKSTGTSNKWSFEGVYLPFAGISIHGWIRKIGAAWFSPWHVPIIEYALTKLKADKILKPNGLSTLILYKFLMRFADWQMLQISAALGGPLWNAIPELKFVKEFILKNNLVECKNNDTLVIRLKRSTAIVDASDNDDERQKIFVQMFQDSLFTNNFYKRLQDVYKPSNDIIQEYSLLEHTNETDSIPFVNDKMKQYNAMCFDPIKIEYYDREDERHDKDDDDKDDEIIHQPKYVDLNTGETVIVRK